MNQEKAWLLGSRIYFVTFSVRFLLEVLARGNTGSNSKWTKNDDLEFTVYVQEVK
jgi:hypothetical protein